MKRSIIIIIILYGIFCKPPKEKEFNDPEWRKESLEISNSICVKLESCIQNEFSELNKDLQKFTRSEMKPEKCNERNKKSRVYLLKGIDPVRIKQITRECSSQIQKYSCEEIRSGQIKTNPACTEMRKIQQGESF